MIPTTNIPFRRIATNALRFRIADVTRSILLLIFVLSETFMAQSETSSVTQLVTVVVKPIAVISISGNPGSLFIQDDASGSEYSAVSDATTKYSCITNQDNTKIIASINERMPEGTRLRIRLSSSKGASNGTVDISEAVAPVDVVTGISRCSDVGQAIDYTFEASPEIYDLPLQTRVVTLTLTD